MPLSFNTNLFEIKYYKQMFELISSELFQVEYSSDESLIMEVITSKIKQQQGD